MAGTDGGAARVTVVGRPGCGRRTVSRVLAAAGLDLIGADLKPDVEVYVLTETLKPEDLAALRAPDRSWVAVLNKADLTGFGDDGPMAVAARHCNRLQDLVGVPVLPLAALPALAGLDDSVLDADMLAALRVLTTEPANLASTDGFATGTHRLSPEVRTRLLAALDLFGIAHAVHAVRCGADAAGLRVALRRASAVDEVLAAVDRLAAAGHYRRLVDETTVEQLDDEVVVTARMTAAIAVLAAEGVTVADAVTAPALLRRAVTWQRYSRGPVSRLHQACGADIVRGSLRLWERAGGVPQPLQPPEPPA